MLEWLASNSGYWTVAIGLIFAGLLFVILGLIGDRWRYGTKTPRCRRCRYDMSGMKPDDPSRKCPECGHEHRHIKLLHRARKGWKRIVLGGLMVWASLYLLLSPDVRVRMENAKESWPIAAIPDTVRLAVWPWLSDETRSDFGGQWAWPSQFINPKPPLILLDTWQARWFVNQLARDSRSDDPIQRKRAMWLAADILQNYDTLRSDAQGILRTGIHDPDVMVMHLAVFWHRMKDLKPSDSDLRRLLEIARRDHAQAPHLPTYATDARRIAIDILARHASRIPESELIQLSETLASIASDYQYTDAALSCLWGIDPDKASKILTQLMRHNDPDIGRIAIHASPTDATVWSMIADCYRESPVDREEYLIGELEYRDAPRWQALLAEWQSSADPLLQAKAGRAVKYLKEFDEWKKRGDPALYAPTITAPEDQPEP